MLEKPPVHSGTVVSPGPLRGGKNPPPNCFTSVKVWGSPPWSTTETVPPFLIVNLSGSKSQPGSGVPAAANANRLANVVLAPRVTFLQKSAPAAEGSLNVTGSHSSKATTWAGLGEIV